jgi:hypothetical protein
MPRTSAASPSTIALAGRIALHEAFADQRLEQAQRRRLVDPEAATMSVSRSGCGVDSTLSRRQTFCVALVSESRRIET